MTDPQASLISMVKAILDNFKLEPDAWTSFTLILAIDPSGKLTETYGYAYNGSGPALATSVKPRTIRDETAAYIKDRFGADALPPKKLKLQFDKMSGRYNVEFEEKDPSRWVVTPENLDQIREELRPVFD